MRWPIMILLVQVGVFLWCVFTRSETVGIVFVLLVLTSLCVVAIGQLGLEDMIKRQGRMGAPNPREDLGSGYDDYTK